MSSQSEIVHAAVRLVKFWTKTLIWHSQKDKRSLSYACELIICKEYEQLLNNLSKPPKMIEILDSFLRQLVNWRSMNTLRTTYYDISVIPDKLLQLNSEAKPLLLDPANPWNNVAHGLPWDDLSELAKTTYIYVV